MRPLALILMLSVVFAPPRAARAQYTPFHHDPKLLLEGNWQSCFDERLGQFDEKIYDQPQLDLAVAREHEDRHVVERGVAAHRRDELGAGDPGKHHVGEDHLVGWAWTPGGDRRPAPGTQARAGALLDAWEKTGSVCPN